MIKYREGAKKLKQYESISPGTKLVINGPFIEFALIEAITTLITSGSKAINVKKVTSFILFPIEGKSIEEKNTLIAFSISTNY